MFKNHPNRACAHLGRKPVCSVTFFHRLHPYLLWSLRQTGGGSDGIKYVSDDLRTEAQHLESLFEDRSRAIVDIEVRISEQQSLRSELIALKLKAARASSASTLLAGAGFGQCPSCGNTVTKETEPDQCPLCKTDTSKRVPTELQSAVIEQDLTDRIEDLKLSLRRLDGSLRNQQRSLGPVGVRRQEVQAAIEAARASLESEYLQRARKLESELGKLNERRRFLMRVRAMPAEIEGRQDQADRLNAYIAKTQRAIAEEEGKFEEGRQNVKDLENSFLEILKAIHFPEISDGDRVQINTKTWTPSIYPKNRPADPWGFDDAGSGGKTVLFKICYALAIHKTAALNDLFLPKIFIVYSPMKNITPDINPEVFENLYKELYRLLNNELSDCQCIVVDQTFSPFKGFKDGMVARKLVSGDPKNPPLIGYYSGH
jgi:hypothetical protein